MKPTSKILLFSFFILILSGSAFGYYRLQYLPAQAAPEPEYQTARVRTGDIRITASGVGNVVPAGEIRLGFRSSGLLDELNVATGDLVTAGQVLARLDDTAARLQLEQAQLNLEALTSPYAAAEAEKALADAQVALEKAADTRTAAQAGNRASDNVIAGLQADLILAEAKVADAQQEYDWLTYLPEDDPVRAAAQTKLTAAIGARDALVEKLDWATGTPTPSEQASLDADVAMAQSRVDAAGALLSALKGEPIPEEAGTALNPDLTKLRQAALALESAQSALENTVLYAPFDGAVTGVSAAVGEQVNTNPLVTLAALDQPLVRFYLEESDLGKIGLGNAVVFTFEAYPDLPITGELIRLEPALATVDGTPVVVAWATLDEDLPMTLLAGMAAEVEVTAAESIGAVLVPVQALRELAPNSYAVFVVQPDGQLKLTPVTVGLKDFANAEILSGLAAGDIVSTGTVETKE